MKIARSPQFTSISILAKSVRDEVLSIFGFAKIQKLRKSNENTVTTPPPIVVLILLLNFEIVITIKKYITTPDATKS